MKEIPKEIMDKIEDEVQQAIKRGGEEYAGYYREGLEDGYQLAPDCEYWKKENERLITLLKNAKTGDCNCEGCQEIWQQFKTENNL